MEGWETTISTHFKLLIKMPVARIFYRYLPTKLVFQQKKKQFISAIITRDGVPPANPPRGYSTTTGVRQQPKVQACLAPQAAHRSGRQAHSSNSPIFPGGFSPWCVPTLFLHVMA
jgi:hypothetical protein